MKNILYIFITLFSVITFSCKEDVGSNSFYNLDTYVDLSVRDAQGNDLLDPSNPEAFAENKIKLYYLVNGEQEEVFDGNLDHPRHFFIYENETDGGFVIRIFPNEEQEDNYSTTYIEWEEGDSDILECEFAKGDNYVIATEVLLNGQLIWNNENEAFPGERYAEIIK